MKNPPWLLVAPDLQPKVGQTVNLDPMEARHAAGSLRRRPGDRVVLVDGDGMVAQAVLRVVEKQKVEAEVLAVSAEDSPRGEGVSVALALVANQPMDWAVQKLVEVGARRLFPIFTDRAQTGMRSAAGRSTHWRRVALQAIKQCRRPWAMDIADVCRLESLMKDERFVRKVVVAHPEGMAPSDLPRSVGRLLIVGPEGGFSPREERLFSDLEWPRVRLGAHTLRSETAAVVGAAMLVARDEGLQEVKSEE
jgi:16S rRNA (uracil1498-N3)-methyltransferase